MSGAWPRLDHAADKGTIESLHLLLQLIGKLPLRLLPWVNHGWHAALRMTPHGAATRSIPCEGRSFTVELDFLEGAIRVQCDRGSRSDLPVAGKTSALRSKRTVRQCRSIQCQGHWTDAVGQS